MKGYTEAIPGLTSPGTPSKKKQTFGLYRSTERQGGVLEELAGAAGPGGPQA